MKDEAGAPAPVFTPVDRDDAISALERAIERLRVTPVQTPCRLCANFDKGWCERWEADVPEAAQDAGCDDWLVDIPF